MTIPDDTSIPLTKQCSKCNNLLPATPEFFRRRKSSPDGLRGQCKSCCAKSPRFQDAGTYKQCRKCGDILPATLQYFYAQKDGKFGLSTWCKSCKRNYSNEWYSNNLERAKENMRVWQRNNLDAVRKSSRKYRVNNPQKRKQSARAWGKRNRDYVKRKSRKWAKDNPHKRRASKLRRRARKHSLPDTFTNDDWQHALDYFNHCCAVCGRQLNDMFGGHTAAADHWIPLDHPDCPGTVPTNIVPLCHGVGGCNNRKSSKMPDEWLRGEYPPKQRRDILQNITTFFLSLKDR